MPRSGTEHRNFDLQGQCFAIKLSRHDNQSASCHSENLLNKHIWSIIKIAQQNEPLETKTPLYNERKTTAIYFFTIS